MSVRAVIFDFGGVLSTSPFEAFTRYERDNGLPEGLIRRLNATNPDANAWAKLERSEVDLAGFAELFETEALAAGHTVDGAAVLGLLGGDLRPQMIEALRRCHDRLKTALLTNNFVPLDAPRDATRRAGLVGQVLDHFDVVVESSRVSLRKPDPAIYRLVCDELGIEPAEAVFLDDLGINLKPARAMGITTIKVVDPDEAIAELEAVVGFPLR
ncbi:MAG TPA: HAD-IA family hydrolase [Acidimicrobiales bacterium]|nr:HAD-IA family hydrolase [Acidimicrobiales bacterium]